MKPSTKRQKTSHSSNQLDNSEPEFENYSQVAKCYDLSRVAVGLNVLKTKVNSQSIVLDAGCGTGNYVMALYPYVKDVVAFELNPQMLIRLENKWRSNNKNGNLSAHQGSLLEPLPFKNNHFDMVMNNQVIHHLDTGKDPTYPNIQLVLAEFYRVLKPGGWLAINLTLRTQVNGFWWQYLIPKVKGEYKRKYLPLQLLNSFLDDVGFINKEKHTIYEPLQGQQYFNIAGPLYTEWRMGDSTWSQVNQKEIDRVKLQVNRMIQAGSMGLYFDLHDKGRLNKGQSTYVLAQKPTE